MNKCLLLYKHPSQISPQVKIEKFNKCPAHLFESLQYQTFGSKIEFFGLENPTHKVPEQSVLT